MASAFPVPSADSLAYITKEPTDEKALLKIYEETRGVLDNFYGSAAGSVEKLKKVNDQALAERKTAYEALDVTQFATLELIDMLTSRDDTLKTRGAQELRKRVDNAEKVTKEKLKKDIREYGLKSLLLTLSRPVHELHLASLKIINEVVDNDAIEKQLRQLDGLEPIGKLVVSSNLEVKKAALFLVVNMSVFDKNREQFRRIPNLITIIVPGLDSSDESVLRMTLKALVNLSILAKNQDIIAKAGALWRLISLIKNTLDLEVKLECFKLLQNLSYCATIKTSVTIEDFKFVQSYLQAKQLYTMATPEEVETQIACLTFFSEIAKYEPNQVTLAGMGFMRSLFLYFMPLGKAGAGLKWNHDIILLVLYTIGNLLAHLDNRMQFLDASGPRFVTAFIEKVIAEFPQPDRFVYESSKVLQAIVSQPGASQLRVQGDADTVSNIASSMFNVLRVFQGEPRIAEMAAKSLRGLSGTEENKRQVVAAGNIPLLCDIVMSSTVKEVIVGTCGLFARLATLPDVRQRYLHGLVPNLTSFLVNNDPELHIPIVTILEAISKDPTGVQIIMTTAGCTVQLILLLDSLSLEVQEHTLLALSNLIFEAPRNIVNDYRRRLLTDGILDALLSFLASPSENIQILSLTLINAMAINEIVKEALLQFGIEKKMADLIKHPNYLRPGNNLTQPVKNLNATLQIKVSEIISVIQQTSEDDDPEKIMDALLGQLTHRQLVTLVKAAINEGAEHLVPTISGMIEANVVIGNARNSAASQERAANETRRSSVAPPPAPLPDTKNYTGPGPAPAYLSPATKRTNAAKKAAAATAKPLFKKLGGDSTQSRGSVLDQIKSFISKPINLRHVDTEEETNKRRAAQRHEEFNRSGIAQGVRAQAQRTKEVRLLDCGVTEGRKYWKKDMLHYVDELNKAFQLDVKFMKLLFEILEHAEGVTYFEVPYGKLADKSVTTAQFAETLNKLGFTLKHRNELHGYEDSMENASRVTVYTQILATYDMPIHSILKTIILAAKQANSSK